MRFGDDSEAPEHDARVTIQAVLDRFVDRLAAHAPLAPPDRRAICSLPFDLKSVRPSTYLMRQGAVAGKWAILVNGYAIEQKTTADGNRQILSIRIANDPVCVDSIWVKYIDRCIKTVTAATILEVELAAVSDAVSSHPPVARALMHEALIDGSIARERAVGLGQRDARARVAHLLCEFVTRMRHSDVNRNSYQYEFPLTQGDIGDATGLTSVHVNRTLKVLEEDGLIQRDRRVIDFLDLDRLKTVADFSPEYLGLLRD